MKYLKCKRSNPAKKCDIRKELRKQYGHLIKIAALIMSCLITIDEQQNDWVVDKDDMYFVNSIKSIWKKVVGFESRREQLRSDLDLG